MWRLPLKISSEIESVGQPLGVADVHLPSWSIADDSALDVITHHIMIYTGFAVHPSWHFEVYQQVLSRHYSDT